MRGVARRCSNALLRALVQAERNTEAATAAQREQAQRQEAELKSLSTRAARALVGEFGSEPKELAKRLLLDERGQCAKDVRRLREFQRALVELKRIPR